MESSILCTVLELKWSVGVKELIHNLYEVCSNFKIFDKFLSIILLMLKMVDIGVVKPCNVIIINLSPEMSFC